MEYYNEFINKALESGGSILVQSDSHRQSAIRVLIDGLMVPLETVFTLTGDKGQFKLIAEYVSDLIFEPDTPEEYIKYPVSIEQGQTYKVSFKSGDFKSKTIEMHYTKSVSTKLDDNDEITALYFESVPPITMKGLNDFLDSIEVPSMIKGGIVGTPPSLEAKDPDEMIIPLSELNRLNYFRLKEGMPAVTFDEKGNIIEVSIQSGAPDDTQEKEKSANP